MTGEVWMFVTFRKEVRAVISQGTEGLPKWVAKIYFLTWVIIARVFVL